MATFVFLPLITRFISGFCREPTIFHENAIFLTLNDDSAAHCPDVTSLIIVFDVRSMGR